MQAPVFTPATEFEIKALAYMLELEHKIQRAYTLLGMENLQKKEREEAQDLTLEIARLSRDEKVPTKYRGEIITLRDILYTNILGMDLTAL